MLVDENDTIVSWSHWRNERLTWLGSPKLEVSTTGIGPSTFSSVRQGKKPSSFALLAPCGIKRPGNRTCIWFNISSKQTMPWTEIYNLLKFYRNIRSKTETYFIRNCTSQKISRTSCPRLVFTSNGVVLGVVIRSVERCDLLKIKLTESEVEHRIRLWLCCLRYSENYIVEVASRSRRMNNHSVQFGVLWLVGSSASASDSDNLVFTRS